MACRLLDRITVQKREGPVMMRKPSSSEGGFRKDRKGHCQHISQKSQSVSQIEKTVPHPPTLLATVPLFVSADVFVKETDASEVFRRAQTNFWVVVLREKVKSFRQSTYPHYLSPTSSVNGGERRTERKWDSFYVPSSDPTRP
jgi:hypothetical protein